MTDEEIEFFIKCLEDGGAIVTPGTGKIFLNGEEITVEELFRISLEDMESAYGRT